MTTTSLRTRSTPGRACTHLLRDAPLIVTRHPPAERDLAVPAAEEQAQLARPRMAQEGRVDAGGQAAVTGLGQGGGGGVKTLGRQRCPDRRHCGGRIEPGGVEHEVVLERVVQARVVEMTDPRGPVAVALRDDLLRVGHQAALGLQTTRAYVEGRRHAHAEGVPEALEDERRSSPDEHDVVAGRELPDHRLDGGQVVAARFQQALAEGGPALEELLELGDALTESLRGLQDDLAIGERVAQLLGERPADDVARAAERRGDRDDAQRRSPAREGGSRRMAGPGAPGKGRLGGRRRWEGSGSRGTAVPKPARRLSVAEA